MATRFPLGPAAVILALDDPRLQYEYSGGLRTETRRTDIHGAPVTRVAVLCLTELADPIEAIVEAPDALLEKVEVGAWATVHGRLQAVVTTSKDSFDVRARIEGVERVAPVEKYATASDFASEVIADAA